MSLDATMDRAAYYILLAGMASAGAGILYSWSVGRPVYVVILILLLGGLIATHRTRPPTRPKLVLLLLSLAVSLYLVEILLALAIIARPILAARSDRRPFDLRTRHRVVRDLRQQGVEAYSGSPPNMFLGHDIPLRPLGGISDAVTVYSNESGEYFIYRSDEHGFHNPAGMWDAPLDVAAIGDSFTHGLCVGSNENAVHWIRDRYPKTLNLGMGSNGPLAALASLSEYLPELAPKKVLWFFFTGNDLRDLVVESADPAWRKYLDGDYHQGLIEKQPQVDRLIRTTLDSREDFETALPTWLDCLTNRYPPKQMLGRAVRFSHSRELLSEALDDPLGYRTNLHRRQISLFAETLRRGRDRVRSWGGRLYFVGLPGWRLAVTGSSKRTALYQEVTAAVESLGVPVIDVVRPFGQHPAPETLFYFTGSHYNPEGYRLAAEVVLRKLEDLP